MPTNSASPRLNATRSARAAMADARSSGTARASALTAQTTLASGRTTARAARVARAGPIVRQTQSAAATSSPAAGPIQSVRQAPDHRGNDRRRLADRRGCKPASVRSARRFHRSNPTARQTFAVARAVRVVCHPADRDRVASAPLDKGRGDIGRRAAKPRPFAGRERMVAVVSARGGRSSRTA